MFTPLACKDIGIKKIEFDAINHFILPTNLIRGRRWEGVGGRWRRRCIIRKRRIWKSGEDWMKIDEETVEERAGDRSVVSQDFFSSEI